MVNKGNNSPVVTRRRSRENRNHHHHLHADTIAARRTSKTLPRGFSLHHGAPSSDSMGSGSGNDPKTDVFGLYGELLNVRDYECDSAGELASRLMLDSGADLRKSDPELSTIPYRVSTLDRRVRMKTSRPRSLDMSSWSVESRGSSAQTSTTSSSSEAGSERPSPSVSRNASFQSTSSRDHHHSLCGHNAG